VILFSAATETRCQTTTWEDSKSHSTPSSPCAASWLSELGPHGIRAVTPQPGGVPETIPESFDGREEITEMIVGSAMLKRAATLDDVGNVAAFAASDHARTMTATALNISCGAIVH
jgi:3-oxoacyl-[acyl-carrier protein] reductase